MKNVSPNCLAIIPARGGSKRIPRKNIKPFAGLPIISYPIKAAAASKCFDTIMVSTDDEEISHIATQCGADVPFLRSSRTANDHAILADVLEEVILRYREQGKTFDMICCILATAALLKPGQLTQAYDALKVNNADACFSVIRYPHPIERALRSDENGMIRMIAPQYMKTRTNDLDPAFFDAGQFYWIATEVFLREKKLFAEKSIPFVLSEIEVQDIDDEVDWKIAEVKYQLNKNSDQ